MTRTYMVAALAAACLAAPVSARQPTIETTIVSHADLNLSRQRDVRVLDDRIARAAKQVCGTASSWDLAGINGVRRCRITTIATFAPRRDAMIADASVRRPALALRD